MENWIDSEVDEIIKEKRKDNKKIKHIDEAKLFLMIIFCAFSFFMIPSACPHAYEISANDICKNEGMSWRCKACGQYCWSNDKDWKGNYHCNSCGKQK